MPEFMHAEQGLKHSRLGKETAYADRYDQSLLFRIPRAENRLRYGINPDQLPFTGIDVWHAYEISFLTNRGLPVSRVMKMTYPADSPFLVESKSLKLYLNSFNMEPCGKSQEEATEYVRQTIVNDLSALLETTVMVTLFADENASVPAFTGYEELASQIPKEMLEAINLTVFRESPGLLSAEKTAEKSYHYRFRSDLLRSNCPVTNQPDWGDLFVDMHCNCRIDLCSIVQYLVSFRKENHFHEEVAEMIFRRFTDAFEPESLMIAAMYTRRGGIDINPVRVTHASLIEDVFLNPSLKPGKTLRQ